MGGQCVDARNRQDADAFVDLKRRLSDAVSETDVFRDHLRMNIRDYFDQHVRLMELEYQPMDA